MPRVLVVAAVVAIIATPRRAEMARAADVVQKSFTYRGDPARALAALLEIPLVRATTATFELSERDELRALPERDAAVRGPQGSLPWLASRASTRIRETVTWNPKGPTLQLDGYFIDVMTAIPHDAGPRWRFSSPEFSKDEVPPGWRAVVAKLMPLPPTKYGITDQRTLEIQNGDVRASASLYRFDTSDSQGRPVEKWFAMISFGPTVGGSVPAPLPNKGPGGCSS